MNPLLDFSGLPRYADFDPALVGPALDTLLADNRALIARLADDREPPTWDTFAAPLYDANEKLHRAWGMINHLNAVMNNSALRDVYNANLPRVTQYYTELGQHQGLFQKFKELKAAPGFASLSRPRQTIIEHELRDFRLGGAELAPESKPRFMKVRERLAALSSKFSDNVLDATNAFAHYVDNRDELSGIPADVLEAAQEAARADGKTGWKFSLHAPSYIPVMQYASQRTLRETLYRAYVTRAAEFGSAPASREQGSRLRDATGRESGAATSSADAASASGVTSPKGAPVPPSGGAEWNNSPLIKDIVALRRELAHLLGFANFADYSLAPKMAESPQHVLDFLNELARRSRPFAERDLVELKEFAASELSLQNLEAWDIAYASEKLREARYAFSDQEIKQYFPEDKVLSGMFGLVQKLYGLSIEAANAPRWHPDVRFYCIRERSGAVVGEFYLDSYARPSKRGGAWMDDAITRRVKPGGMQTPVAYLNCNFAPPVGGKPALLTHDEVITLFHEFGHGLHHLLTRMDELGVSGINGVEWDAVELPSQFMENFCWEWDIVRPMTRHVTTGEPLPRILFERMLAAKNFQSGMQMVRQLEFALFDLHLHYDFDPNGPQSVGDLLNAVRRQVAVLFPPEFNRFPNSFTHVFAGGYAAGYYSYKWAEVLSADAYSVFEEHGVLDPATGKRFHDEILGVGGSRPALESFVAFRGRPPRIDALLRHSGMA